MNTKLTITTILATASLATTALADKGRGVKPIPNPEILKVLENSPLAKEFANPDFPDVDSFDPGARCTDISASKLLNMPLYSQTMAGIPFSLGAGIEFGIVADDQKLAAQASIGPTAEFFGETEMPLDVTFSASTKVGGLNSLDISINALGSTITTYNVADTTVPLSYIDGLGWSLPDALTASIGDSYGVPSIDDVTENVTFTWGVSAAAVADLGAILIFRVSPNGVEARSLINANVYAALNAQASLTGRVNTLIAGWRNFNASARATSRLDIMRFLTGNRALLVPQGAHWLADAAAVVFIDDAMGAEPLTVRFNVFDVYEPKFTPFGKLVPTSWSGDWAYSCSFDKKFK
jgi:hypothetical protein